MKITNWRRKLSAALIAGGLLVPSAAGAAALNTNLVSDPGFEDVSTVTCCYSAWKLNSWADGSQSGFAYNYSQMYDGGGPLAGGGTYYFTANAEGTGGADIRTPGQVAQKINLSTGPTAAAIAIGQATFQLGAFFSSYAPDTDFGSLQVDFLSSGGATLGSALITDTPGKNKVWRRLSTSGLVPIGTAMARISPFGTVVTGLGGPDGYIDNVDFRIVPEASTVTLVGMGLAAGLLLRHRRLDYL